MGVEGRDRGVWKDEIGECGGTRHVGGLDVATVMYTATLQAVPH